MAFALVWMLPMAGNAGPFAGHEAVSDTELAQMRGGFRLPNGVEVAMAVQIDSIVNGQLVLRSVLVADQGPARLEIYSPGDSKTQGAGTAIPVSGGITVETPNGLVSVNDKTGRVVLTGDGLQVQHLVGRALGTIISNEKNGRTIDNNMVVHLNLSRATPDRIGSSLLRAADVALDSLRRRGE
ncbi:MAG: hypothetical protein WCZ66_02530 [Sphingomonadaceae bacterium]